MFLYSEVLAWLYGSSHTFTSQWIDPTLPHLLPSNHLYCFIPPTTFHGTVTNMYGTYMSCSYALNTMRNYISFAFHCIPGTIATLGTGANSLVVSEWTHGFLRHWRRRLLITQEVAEGHRMSLVENTLKQKRGNCLKKLSFADSSYTLST